MTASTRKIIRRYVDLHGKAKVAEAAHVSQHTLHGWLRPESNKAHRSPSTQSLIVLAHALGKPKPE